MKHEPRQVIHLVKPVRTVWVGLKVEWGKASGNHQAEQEVLARLIEIQLWC